jgi:hypothetical protein
MEHSYKGMQMENHSLREYIIHLQSRLLDTQGEYPQPPAGVNLSQPGPQGQAAFQPSSSESTAANPAAGTPLEAVAQAVAGLREQERISEARYQPGDNKSDDMRTAEEIKQLRDEGLP